MKYRKLPVVIEAFKWTGGPDQTEDPKWIIEAMKRGDVQIFQSYNNKGNLCPYLVIGTLEGKMHANPGDYIIKGTAGEIYPCKPNIFEKIYELAGGIASENEDLKTIKNFTLNRKILDAAERMDARIQELEKENTDQRYQLEALRMEIEDQDLETMREANAHKNAVIQDLQDELKKAAEKEMNLLKSADAALLDQAAQIRLLQKNTTSLTSNRRGARSKSSGPSATPWPLKWTARRSKVKRTTGLVALIFIAIITTPGDARSLPDVFTREENN